MKSPLRSGPTPAKLLKASTTNRSAKPKPLKQFMVVNTATRKQDVILSPTPSNAATKTFDAFIQNKTGTDDLKNRSTSNLHKRS